MKEESVRPKIISNPNGVPLMPQALRELIASMKANGGAVEAAAGKVPHPANDTAITTATEALDVGTRMADGSIYVGLTTEGTSQIFAMPTDLIIRRWRRGVSTVTFNDAAKAIQRLNSHKSFGHDDWQIPSLENLRALYKNQNEGALQGTFRTVASSGSDCPYWYWSSTEHRDYPSIVWFVRFSGGDADWHHKGYSRLSCRPVRLVEVSSAPAPGAR
jgi:hypothetical protein